MGAGPGQDETGIGAAAPAPLDPGAFHRACAELAAQLARNSLWARGAFEALRRVLAGTGTDAELAQLGDHIERLEFDRAAACLDALAARMDPGGGG